MMSSRRSLYVMCPYYKTDDALRIKCEGFQNPIVSTHVILKLCPDCEDHIRKYCYTKYKDCPLYQIIDRKYEDE